MTTVSPTLPFRESQPFHILLLALGVAAAVFVGLTVFVPDAPGWVFLFPLVIVVAVLLFFHRLETVVDRDGIRITFGHGPIGTRISPRAYPR